MTPTNDKVDQSGADERDTAMRKAFADLYEFEVWPSDGWRVNSLNNYAWGWYAALKYADNLALQAQPSAPANPNAALSHDDICKFMPPEFMFGDALQPHHLRDIISAVRSAPANMPASDAASDLRKLFVELTNTPEVSESGAVVGHIIFNEQLDRLEKLAAAPQQPVAASSKPVKLTDWDRISKAAATACNEYGQWMPERWVHLFVAAYNKE